MYVEGQYIREISSKKVVSFLKAKDFAAGYEVCYCKKVEGAFVVIIGNRVTITLTDFDAIIESEDDRYKYNHLDITALKRAWRRYVYIFQLKEDRLKFIEDFHNYIDKTTFGIENTDTATV